MQIVREITFAAVGYGLAWIVASAAADFYMKVAF